MAVAPTGAIYKSLSFDGEDSRDYGVYITGEAVYNAPERDVEMITIPGRSGTFALDNGRFENIEVSYPAGIFADTEADFIQAISDFRNFLCSRKGYVRLQDEYNPDEYRMAVYKSGLNVTPAMLKAGEFTITFNCKPQRWLVSGETAVEVESGDELTNPTPFEASPLLAVEGYGKIEFNGYEIELENSILGHILLKSGQKVYPVSGSSHSVSFSETLLDTADTITLEATDIYWRLKNASGTNITRVTVSSNTGITGSSASPETSKAIGVHLPNLTFAKGTSSSYTNTTVISGTRVGGATFTAQIVIGVAYNGSGTITFSFTDTYSDAQIVREHINLDRGDITGESTQSLLGHPTYIDCDLGDAYRIEGGEYVSLNGNVDLGSDLPKLGVGANEITFDNTITELKVQPRWWKV